MNPTFEFQPTLKGELVTMRPYSDLDWAALLSVASDTLIWEQHPIHRNWSEAVFRKSIEDALGEHGSLVATETATGRIIGHSRYSTRYVQSGELEIGWSFLARRYWGGRWNREMKRLMIAHALADWPMAVFRIGEHNLRSRLALERLGGRLLERDYEVWFEGQSLRHVLYAIDQPVAA